MLLCYVYSGHLSLVRWLVKEAKADANRPNDEGCTPLFFACELGHIGVAQWLVREAGAQVCVRLCEFSCVYFFMVPSTS